MDIRTQYEMGVRCLTCASVLITMVISTLHMGCANISTPSGAISSDLNWLDQKGDCYVRVLHEAHVTNGNIQRPVVAALAISAPIMVKDSQRTSDSSVVRTFTTGSLTSTSKKAKKKLTSRPLTKGTHRCQSPVCLMTWWPWLLRLGA